MTTPCLLPQLVDGFIQTLDSYFAWNYGGEVYGGTVVSTFESTSYLIQVTGDGDSAIAFSGKCESKSIVGDYECITENEMDGRFVVFLVFDEELCVTTYSLFFRDFPASR
jgi:hypothetical protein